MHGIVETSGQMVFRRIVHDLWASGLHKAANESWASGLHGAEESLRASDSHRNVDRLWKGDFRKIVANGLLEIVGRKIAKSSQICPQQHCGEMRVSSVQVQLEEGLAMKHKYYGNHSLSFTWSPHNLATFLTRPTLPKSR